MRLLLDCDGVVCNFVGGFLDIVKEVTGREYVPEQMGQWSLEKSTSLTPEEEKIVHAIHDQPGFASMLKEFEHAVEAVTLLREKLDVVFLTKPNKRTPTWAYERYNWIQERWPGIPVVSTASKKYVAGHFLLDDDPRNLDAWSGENPVGTPLLWSAPYNDKNNNFIRVKYWTEAADAMFPGGGSWLKRRGFKGP